MTTTQSAALETLLSAVAYLSRCEQRAKAWPESRLMQRMLSEAMDSRCWARDRFEASLNEPAEVAPLPCDGCGKPVAWDQGIEDGRRLYCSPECQTEDYACAAERAMEARCER